MAQMISSVFPALHVQIIDVEEPGVQIPAAVFAIPTYLLNGKLLWLGNPHREEAIQHIHNLLEAGQET